MEADCKREVSKGFLDEKVLFLIWLGLEKSDEVWGIFPSENRFPELHEAIQEWLLAQRSTTIPFKILL